MCTNIATYLLWLPHDSLNHFELPLWYSWGLIRAMRLARMCSSNLARSGKILPELKKESIEAWLATQTAIHTIECTSWLHVFYEAVSEIAKPNLTIICWVIKSHEKAEKALRINFCGFKFCDSNPLCEQHCTNDIWWCNRYMISISHGTTLLNLFVTKSLLQWNSDE